jgi:hypothetical protein
MTKPASSRKSIPYGCSNPAAFEGQSLSGMKSRDPTSGRQRSPLHQGYFVFCTTTIMCSSPQPLISSSFWDEADKTENFIYCISQTEISGSIVRHKKEEGKKRS